MGVTSKDLIPCPSRAKDVKHTLKTQGQSIHIAAEMQLPNTTPMKLGDTVFLKLKVENVGRVPIAANSLVLFKDNSYFQECNTTISKSFGVGQEILLDIILVPKTKSSKSNLDSQLLAVPEFLEMVVFDSYRNQIECNCFGFFVNHEDFSGDIYKYCPPHSVKYTNIITFGPRGAGKSTFVNSVASALSDSVVYLNVVGATTNLFTSSLKHFPLNYLYDLKFDLYDIPGTDGKNYKGDEVGMLMHGLLPMDIDFKDATLYNHVQDKRDLEETELARRVHVVAFFVPHGCTNNSSLMAHLAVFYYQITVVYKQKVVVIIPHADKISSTKEREQVTCSICSHFSIDSSNVFFLENYIDSNVKKFHLDKSVLRILLALLNSADEFLIEEHLHPTTSPFPKNPFVEKQEQQDIATSTTANSKLLRKIKDLNEQLEDIADSHEQQKSQIHKLERKLQKASNGSQILSEEKDKLQQQTNTLQECVIKLEQELQVAIANKKQLQVEHHVLPSTVALTQHKSANTNNTQFFHQLTNYIDNNKDLNDVIATQIEEFSQEYTVWERTLIELDATDDATHLLQSMRNTHQGIVKEFQHFSESTSKAAQAVANLKKYEEQLQGHTARLQVYVDKKLIRESEDYRELLISISELSITPNPKKTKCFISYAWYPDNNKNSVLQARLIKLKEDLERAGIEVLLDIHNMEGDINHYMLDGIQNSDRVIIICTPRFKERAEETGQAPNNLQKELTAVLQKQQTDPKFIIPLILEGNRSTSIAKAIEQILSLDFTERQKYCENMISLSPKGLIPMILGLERHRMYGQLLKGYHDSQRLQVLSKELQKK